MNNRIAIIGGGIAGLTAAYLLNEKYEIALFEKDNRLGGNAYTHITRDGLSFDIAAAIFGKNGYPSFYRLLSSLNVETTRFSNISFNLQNLDTSEGLYFTPLSLKALIAQQFAMFKPRNFLSMVGGILPMMKAKKLYRSGKLEGLTMAEAFNKLPKFYGDSKLFTMFMLCLISSMYYDEVMKAPASFFIEKMEAHKDFFSPKALYSVFIAKYNTQSYINALSSHYRDRIILNSRIKSIARSNKNKITIKMEDGSKSRFGRIVFACNADQALKLLEDPTDEENRLLGAWKYKDGPIVVHKDASQLPDRDLCKMFTCVYTVRNGSVHTSINGHTWNLAGVPDTCPYTSTQHPNFHISEDLVDFKKIFRTPIYDADSVATIKALPTLNGKRNTYYCGSHFGFGLHEDAVTSAITVANRLGVTKTKM